VKDLKSNGITAMAIHGNKSQNERVRALKQFKEKTIRVLVATDVASRGIDIERLSHVINFELPETPESYVHRIGRTGRAGRTGTAISLALPTDRFRVRQIERVTNQPMIASKVPTNEEIESRRWERLLETLRMAMQTAQADQALPQYRALVGQLSQEYSLEDIAAISLKLSQQKGVAG